MLLGSHDVREEKTTKTSLRAYAGTFECTKSQASSSEFCSDAFPSHSVNFFNFDVWSYKPLWNDVSCRASSRCVTIIWSLESGFCSVKSLMNFDNSSWITSALFGRNSSLADPDEKSTMIVRKRMTAFLVTESLNWSMCSFSFSLLSFSAVINLFLTSSSHRFL
jgi:hypothetical protein